MARMKMNNNTINGSLAEDGLRYGECKDNTYVAKNRPAYTFTSAMTYVREGIMEGINLKCMYVESTDGERFELHCVASDGCDFVFSVFKNIGNNRDANVRKLFNKLNALSLGNNFKEYLANKAKGVTPNWLNLNDKSFYAMFCINDKGFLQLVDIEKVKEDDGLERLKKVEEEEVAKDFFN